MENKGCIVSFKSVDIGLDVKIMRQMKLIFFYLGTLCGSYSVGKPYNVQSMFEQSQMHSPGLYGVRSSGSVLLCSRYLTSGSQARGV